MSLSPLSARVLALAEIERRRRSKKLVTPSFRGAAADIQNNTAAECIISGPSETGKTFALLYSVHNLLMRYPNARATLVRKVRATIYGTVLETYKRVIEYGDMAVTPYGGVNPSMYLYANGARLYIGGMDNPGKILSGERDVIVVNQAEELDAQDWEYLITRTTGRGAVVPYPATIGDANPAAPEHWILKRAAAGTLKLLKSYHMDNPSLHDGTDWTEQGRRSISRLQGLTGARYARLYQGEWVADDGDDAFLPSIALWDNCVADVAPATSHQPVIIGLDGAVSGDTFAAVAVSRNPDIDNAIVVRDVRVWSPTDKPLDYGAIENEIREMLDTFNVVQVTYDPFQLHYLAQRLSGVVWCKPFIQGADRLEADAQLRSLIVQRQIAHDGTAAVLRAHLGNADAKMDESGHKLRMVKRHAAAKIDAAVALSMASYRALELNLY
jgi:hypothetical protein